MIDVSIIIVNYKSWNSLRECLDAIKNINTKRFSFETIVVDNRSNDNNIQKFAKEYPLVNFKLNSGNNGFANGCNTGANIAKGDYLLFLNPDTIANENALFGLWETAKNNSDIGIVSCSQINEKGQNYKEIRFFPSLKTLFGIFRVINVLCSKKQILTNFNSDKNIIFPNWATGAVIFMSTHWYKKINGWNEKYWLYFEDVDICKRVVDNDGKIALIRTTNIIHKHGGASRVNIKTKALTKTEVLISKHVYFNEHSKGFLNLFVQIILVSTILFEKTVLAIFGILFFFIPKIKVNLYIFKNIFSYYISAFYHKTWTSPRSMLYKKN